jgi:hypothetical protein
LQNLNHLESQKLLNEKAIAHYKTLITTHHKSFSMRKRSLLRAKTTQSDRTLQKPSYPEVQKLFKMRRSLWCGKKSGEAIK